MTDLASAGPSVAAALGSGLLVGLERERRKGTGPDRDAAGIRSFTVAALLGVLAQLLSTTLEMPALVLLGGGLVGALATVAYVRSAPRDPGLTTELALFTTYLIGVLCGPSPALGAAAAVLLAMLLAARGRLHHFASQVLSESELHDGLLLGALTLVVLPLIPAGPVGWLGGADPRRMALLVVLILALQAVGHIALRLFGARAGLALAGVCSGFVSSTATIASLGAKLRQGQAPLGAALAGAIGSTAATWIQVQLILLATAPALSQALWPAAAAGLSAAALGTVWHLRRVAAPTAAAAPAAPPGPVLRVREALLVAAALTIVTVVVAWAQGWAGHAGVLVSAALSGLADAHAATAALGSLTRSGALPLTTAALGVLAALSANTAMRIGVAFSTGGRAFGWGVSVALLTSTSAGWLAWWAVQR